MCRAIDFLFGTLDEDNRILGYLDWSERRLGRTVGYVVVGGTRIVHAPQEIVSAFAVEHVRSLAEGIILQRTALWGHECFRFRFDAHHVFVQFCAGHVAVAPIKIAFSAYGIFKHIHVYLLPVFLTFRPTVYDRMSGIGERSARVVCGSYSDGFPVGCVAAEIEEIFVFSVYFLFDDTRCPGVTVGPLHLVGTQVEHDTFVAPVGQIFGTENREIVSAPSRSSVGSGIDVILFSLFRVQDFRIGMKFREYGIACLGSLSRKMCRNAQQTGNGENG